MASAYSYDLRKRVINSVDAGQSIAKSSKTYQVGRATVYRWVKKCKEEGNIRPKTH